MKKILKQWSRQLRLPFSRYLALQRLKQYHAKAKTLEDAVDWSMHFGRYGLCTVSTLQIPSEITRLAKAVEALNPKTILEIGTARGGTLLLWSRLAADKVVSCDLRDMRAVEPVFTAFPPPGSACRVTLLSGDSHQPAFRTRVEQALGGEQVDFLFIDGDHTEAGVTADFNDYRHLVRPGGIIAFHDIVEKQPFETNQVHRLWQQLRQAHQVEEFIDNPAQCGFGIGIIRVPG